MTHLAEEDLVDMYYGEDSGEADKHLRTCRECTARYATLKQSLDAIKPMAVPHRGADYGESVWQKLQPRLIPYEQKNSAVSLLGWKRWRAAGLVLSCALVLAAVFLGGRYWERISTKQPVASANAQTAKRVVVVVLADHLDRSERLLVQLNHADWRDRSENELLQSEAQELLASNRLYRTAATNAGDPDLARALDRLEGVLAEIANNPNFTAADLRRVRREMNTEGILFEIRVLMTGSPDKESGLKPAKGALI